MEEKGQESSGSLKTLSRSLSCIDCPPRKSSSKPLWNSKARACLPPLQPLCIVRPSVEEWPKAGCDDIGIWAATPSTPSANSGSAAPLEADCRRNGHSLYDKECSRVLDHVYLGCNAVAKDREILCKNGITHVLNCVGYSFPEYFKNEFVYKTLWLQDCPSEDITSVLYDVFDYFEEVCEQRGRVLVHCCRGVSRSASLVIAYLMWKQGISFSDAFQHVKAARGVADPNVGFACQLMQCQKRVHALPASPNSLLRMFRMAPHSPYDSLHLVPKPVSDPGVEKLDSRGAFIVVIPSAIFIWTGKLCPQAMSDTAMRAAFQVIRYEKARGEVVTVKENEEGSDFWDAFSCRSSEAKAEGGKRKVESFDMDFQIFHQAVSGGVVPPLVSGSKARTRLPARESGWNASTEKLATEDSKRQSKMHTIPETHDVCSEPSSSSLPSDEREEEEEEFPPLTRGLSRSPSFSLVESFSMFCLSKRKSSSQSASSASPSTPDYSSSVTFSPSSSNCSDLSSASAQPSPCRLEPRETDTSRNLSLNEKKGLADGEAPELVNDVNSG